MILSSINIFFIPILMFRKSQIEVKAAPPLAKISTPFLEAK
jgi:hypothetical protein